MGDRNDYDSDFNFSFFFFFSQCLTVIRPPSSGDCWDDKLFISAVTSLLNKVLYSVGNFWDFWNSDVIQHNDILSDEDVDSFGKMI